MEAQTAQLIALRLQLAESAAQRWVRDTKELAPGATGETVSGARSRTALFLHRQTRGDIWYFLPPSELAHCAGGGEYVLMAWKVPMANSRAPSCCAETPSMGRPRR